MVEGIILPYGDSLGVPVDQPLGVGGGGIVEGSEVGGEEGDQDQEEEGEGRPYAPVGHSLARGEHSGMPSKGQFTSNKSRLDKMTPLPLCQ